MFAWFFIQAPAIIPSAHPLYDVKRERLLASQPVKQK
jgi:hypothetical protein